MTLNFSGQDLREQSFLGQELIRADFSHADLRGTEFTGANLRGANFRYSKIGLGNLEELKRLLILKLRKERFGYSFYHFLFLSFLIFTTFFFSRFLLLTVIFFSVTIWWQVFYLPKKRVSITEAIFGTLVTVITVMVILANQNIPLLEIFILLLLFIYTVSMTILWTNLTLVNRHWYQKGIQVISDVIASKNYKMLTRNCDDFLGGTLVNHFIVEEIIMVTTSFREVDLTDADFSHAISCMTDFLNANLTRANFDSTIFEPPRSIDQSQRFLPPRSNKNPI